jgi:hypothetical protein
VVLDKVLSESSKESDGGRRGVEVRDAVLVDDIPVPRGGGVDGSRLEDGGGDSAEGKKGEKTRPRGQFRATSLDSDSDKIECELQQGSVNDVCVSSDPSNVGHARELRKRKRGRMSFASNIFPSAKTKD